MERELAQTSLEFLGATIGEFGIGITGSYISYRILRLPYAENISSDLSWDLFLESLVWGLGTGAIIGTPLGTVLTGKIVHDKGSVLGAYVGGVVGTGLGMLTLICFGDKISEQITIPTFLLLPPTCSVIGYNLFPHKSDSQSYLSPKNFPELALTVLPQKYGNKISPKIGAKVTVRF